MRLVKIQDFLQRKGILYQYLEENGCGSISFVYGGFPYHIWEFPASDPGAESNVRTAGRSEEFNNNYEEEILNILKEWK